MVTVPATVPSELAAGHRAVQRPSWSVARTVFPWSFTTIASTSARRRMPRSELSIALRAVPNSHGRGLSGSSRWRRQAARNVSPTMSSAFMG